VLALRSRILDVNRERWKSYRTYQIFLLVEIFPEEMPYSA